MAISGPMRFQILRRDGFQCQTCGRKSPDVELEVDHVRPVALGGLDVPENLQALCRECNRGKAATPADAEMVGAVRDRHDEYVRARAQAVAIHRAERERVDPVLRAVEQYWAFYRFGREGVPRDEWETAPKPDQWELTLREFLIGGLTEEEALELVDVAAKSCRTSATMWGRFYHLCVDHMDQVDQLTRRIMAGGAGDST